MATCIWKTAAGNPCKNHAMEGQTECHKHGGTAPQKIQAAANRKREEAAKSLLANTHFWDESAPPVTDPIPALQQVTGTTKNAISILGEQLKPQDECICCGRGDLDPVVATAFRVLLKEYHQMLVNQAKLDIGEKYLKIEMAKVSMVGEALTRTFEHLGLNESQQVSGHDFLITTLEEIESKPRHDL